MSTDAEVNKYLDSVLAQIKDWLEQRKVRLHSRLLYVSCDDSWNLNLKMNHMMSSLIIFIFLYINIIFVGETSSDGLEECRK